MDLYFPERACFVKGVVASFSEFLESMRTVKKALQFQHVVGLDKEFRELVGRI